VFLVCLAKGFKCFEKLKLIISLKEEIEIDKIKGQKSRDGFGKAM
jgi:hypothetical protein